MEKSKVHHVWWEGDPNRVTFTTQGECIRVAKVLWASGGRDALMGRMFNGQLFRARLMTAAERSARAARNPDRQLQAH